MEEKIREYKNKLEAVLFAAGKRLSIEELSKMTRIRDAEAMKQALAELKKEYDEKESSLIVEMTEDADMEYWKLTVKNQMIPLIKRIVTRTEFKKSVIETLAYIAYKYPIKQSDLVKIRSNKAYDHLRELENAGYISRQRYGRTRLIKLTDKFFDYFDLPPDKIKEQLKDFDQLEKVILDKEKEIKGKIEEHRQKQEETRKISEKEKMEMENLDPDLDKLEIDLVGDKGKKAKLEIYDEELSPEDRIHEVEVKPEIEAVEETLGDLEVIDEPLEELADVKKDKEPEHVGNLDVYEEEGLGKDVGDKSGAEVGDEVEDDPETGDIENNEGSDEQDAKPEEETTEESEIDKEIMEQKESLKPQEDAEFGKGFDKPVEEYLEGQAEIRAEEMMHEPEPDEDNEFNEEEKPLIEMPAEHKIEETDDEEVEEEPVKEEQEDEVIKGDEERQDEDRKEGSTELPPMDDFDEEDNDDVKK